MPIRFGKTKTFANLLQSGSPVARAQIAGSPAFSSVHGSALFYGVRKGTLLVAEVFGLPDGFLGFHVHEGNACAGSADDPFAASRAHYNPQDNPHPAHAGDLPPLLASGGYAWLAVFTERFRPSEVVGKTIVVHEKPDDFTTQPSGGAGEKIACGQIRAVS